MVRRCHCKPPPAPHQQTSRRPVLAGLVHPARTLAKRTLVLRYGIGLLIRGRYLSPPARSVFPRWRAVLPHRPHLLHHRPQPAPAGPHLALPAASPCSSGCCLPHRAQILPRLQTPPKQAPQSHHYRLHGRHLLHVALRPAHSPAPGLAAQCCRLGHRRGPALLHLRQHPRLEQIHPPSQKR